MGYFIRPLPWKKSDPKWKVQFVSYKKTDAKESQALKPKKEWDVEKSKWRSLGFHALMSLDEARVRSKQLNSQAFLKEQERRVQLRKIEDEQNAKRYDSVFTSSRLAPIGARSAT